MMSVTAVVVAAGEGLRFGRPKPFVVVRDRPLVAWSLRTLRVAPGYAGCVLVVRTEDRRWIETEWGADLARWGVIRIVEGGARRQDSVENGALATDPATDLVMIHDAARPLVRPDDVVEVVEAAGRHGAALLAVPAGDTIKRGDAEGFVVETPPRAGLWQAQTPQIVRRDLLLEALALARTEGREVSDDVAAVEALGRPVRLVAGHRDNLKVTVPEDLAVVEAVLAARSES